jgi:CRISPR-associated endonuclease/helicase Cas3
MDFDAFFRETVGSDRSPYLYQQRLACGQTDDLRHGRACESLLIDVPTGCGKTAAVVLAWLWNRMHRESPEMSPDWPRRLVYILPMRSLAGQIHENVKGWLRSDLLKGKDIGLHLLMGGEDEGDWNLHPEKDAILIGTQDILISRALNRGYGLRRFRWPMHFGLLNNDCLWVMDETQLMGNALATTVQLDAFRRKLWTPQFSCPCWWMSATVGGKMFDTRDRQDFQMPAPEHFQLLESERKQEQIACRLEAAKSIQTIPAAPKPTSRDGKGILDEHRAGRITLVILNTVASARTMYQEIDTELKSKRFQGKAKPELVLLHSRFRRKDRQDAMDKLQTFIEQCDRDTGAKLDDPGLIVVSTQVIEAGMDISAAVLWSEIAIWPSVIQRLGRLNREGLQPDAAAFFWMPRAEAAENKKDSPNGGRVGPYERPALEVAENLLKEIAARQAAGVGYRAALDEAMQSDQSKHVMSAEPEAVIRPDDLHDLFSTEPDLAGGFTDVSPYVRDQDRNADAQVFWRELVKNKQPKPDEQPAPRPEEICAVPFHELRLFLDRTKAPAWEWDEETGQWVRRRGMDVFPGMTLMLAREQGGYSAKAGWTGSGGDNKFEAIPPPAEERESLATDLDSESNDWRTLAQHTGDVRSQMESILRGLTLTDSAEGRALLAAARWHDVGKAHPHWQKAVGDYVAKALEKLQAAGDDPKLNPKFRRIIDGLRAKLQRGQGGAEPWGKFPDLRPAWTESGLPKEEADDLAKRLLTPFQPGLRHDAASALAAWQHWLMGVDGLTALACYLAAAHHGKVRTVLRAGKRGAGAVFGLREGDELPALPGYIEEPLPLDLAPRLLGLAGGWDEKNNALFTPAGAPSWVAAVGELLGPVLPEDVQPASAIPPGEPRGLGPFRLAYLEALLTAADIRGSKKFADS